MVGRASSSIVFPSHVVVAPGLPGLIEKTKQCQDRITDIPEVIDDNAWVRYQCMQMKIAVLG